MESCLFGVASFTIFVNTFVVLDRMIKTGYPHVPADDSVLLFISIVNFVLLFAIIIWSWRNSVSEHTTPIRTDVPSQIKNITAWITGKSDNKAIKKPDEYVALKVNRKDILIMTIMTVIYLAITFINLGSFDVPQTDWVGKNATDGFIIELMEETYISRLTYYRGLGTGSFKAWYLDADGSYEPLTDIKIDDFYKWGHIPIDQTTKRIKVKVEQPGGMIKETAVFGANETIALPFRLLDLEERSAASDLLNLSDEQHIAQYSHSYITGTYFDEIYYARTAYEHLNRINPYEWTHPPLGKILIAVGIALFGMNTFGWRVIGTLFGAAMIPLMYLFGKKLFKKSFYGFCAAFLMMFDLMHFAQTRIATIDVYATFFVILMYYFIADYYLLKSNKNSFSKSIRPLFLSGLFFGMGIATKWSVLYGAPGLALIFILTKYDEYKTLKKDASAGERTGIRLREAGIYISCVFIFIIMPAAIYLLSYIPYLLVPGMRIADIFRYQRYMYDYHSTLAEPHPFSSQWWSWPIILKPIWYYRGGDVPSGMASTIVSLGNPAVWWMGIVAVCAAIRGVIRKNKACILLIFAIATQYIPWALVTRTTFIYHFFLVIPFVMAAIVYLIKEFMESGMKKFWVCGYFAVVMFVFIMFYPVVSGLTVPESYIKLLRWFHSWYF